MLTSQFAGYRTIAPLALRHVGEQPAGHFDTSLGPRAALAAATANRNNVYAGVRAEQIASIKAEIAKAKSRLEYAGQQVRPCSPMAGFSAST